MGDNTYVKEKKYIPGEIIFGMISLGMFVFIIWKFFQALFGG